MPRERSAIDVVPGKEGLEGGQPEPDLSRVAEPQR